MKRFLEVLRQTWIEIKDRLKSLETRQLFLWCAPALVAGLILRVLLMWQMPSAFFHDDTRFIVSSSVDVAGGNFKLNNRRPYLVPIVYAVPIALHLPFLPAVAAGQHLLGLLMVLEAGFLCRLWFPRWKLWVLPLTILLALNPVILWYEHAALPEFLFIFGAFNVALFGAWLLREPRPLTLVLFLCVLFLNAGTRPEANLLFLFGMMAVVRAYWGNWRPFAVAVGVALLITLAGFKATKTRQGGKLLLTTLLPSVPANLWTAPKFGEAVEELRAVTRAKWVLVPHDVNSYRKKLEKLVAEHLMAVQGLDRDAARDQVDSFCRRVAFETILRSPWDTVVLAQRKFQRSLEDYKLREEHPEIPSGNFGPDFVYKEQGEYLYGRGGRGAEAQSPEGEPAEVGWTSSHRWSQLYLGVKPERAEEVQPLLHQRYQPYQPDWLTSFQVGFYRWFFAWNTPPLVKGHDRIPGMPVIYLLSLAGLLLLSLLQPPRILNGIQLWTVMLLLLAYAIFLTGNSIARYRMVFEPYWWIGLFGCLEVALGAILAALALSRGSKHPPGAASERSGSGR